MNEFKSKNCITTLLNESVFHVTIHDFKDLEKSDIVDIIEWVKSKSSKTDWVNLFEFGVGSGASKEARKFASTPEANEITGASAVIVRNLAQQFILDYYMKFNKPLKPTAVFYKKYKALEWVEKKLGQKV